MKKIIKAIGVILVVGVIVIGILYLLSSTEVASEVNPGSIFGQLVGGFQDALNSLQETISNMFRNFTR